MSLKAYVSQKTLTEIGASIDGENKRTNSGIQAFTVADANLGGMQVQHVDFIAELDAIAAANPGNVFWQQQKAQKDLLVAEFLALKTYTDNLKTAVGGVSKP